MTTDKDGGSQVLHGELTNINLGAPKEKMKLSNWRCPIDFQSIYPRGDIDGDRTELEDSYQWYSSWIESRIRKVSPNIIQPRLLGLQNHVSFQVIVRHIYTMIQYIVHRLYEEDHISFGRLVSALSEERLLRPGQASENVAYQLVFILVGLATFFYTPSLTPKDGEFEITPSSEEKTQYVSRGLWAVKQIQIDAESEQSIGDVIKQFSGGKHLLLYSRWVEDDSKSPQNREDVLVKVTNVNYWTLRKFIGIKVIFVDSVWEHLAFEQRTKTLKLFQYPSFCLMLCVRNSKGTFLGRFFDNYFEDIIRERGFSPVNSHDFFRELVFTYRLIFGQSRDAYKAFRSDYENKLDEKDIDRDPLLYRLCGSDWSNECLYDELDAPHIRTVYSTMSDFPFFGQRLIELQEYVLSQSPDNFTTLWRDRRDITTFYTLWAALIFGITTTILGIIQVGLQMAQLGATA